MVFIQNTNLNPKKQLYIALMGIYGVGQYQAKQICDLAGFCPYTKLTSLSANEIALLSQVLSTHYETSSEIKRKRIQNIQHLISNGSYRGFRHSLGLPTRGQQTHSNARTAKKLNKKHSFK